MPYTLKSWTERCTRLAGDKSASTQKHYDTIGRRLVADLGDVKLSAVKPAQAADWTAGLGVSINTRAYYVRFAKAIFARAVREGEIEENPFRYEKSKGTTPAKDWVYFDDAAMDKLLAACPSDPWRRLIALCRWAGMRSHEARALEWAQIKGDRASIVGKGGLLRSFPLVPRLRAILGDPGEGKPCDGLPVGPELPRRAAAIFALGGFGRSSQLHALRKCAAMDMVRKYGERRAGYVLGHSLAVAAATYDRLTPDDLTEMATG